MIRLRLILAAALFLLGSSLASAAPTKPWDRLDGCTLVPWDYSDGDSFKVRYSGSDYVFRLYFVDCPETDLSFPDRVADQAAYFGISVDQTIEVAAAAQKRVLGLLGRGPFTVLTQWRSALGRTKRFYALIAIPSTNGAFWLDQDLVRNGLARVYGSRTTLPDGAKSDEYRQMLIQLENRAKSEARGGWGFREANQ